MYSDSLSKLINSLYVVNQEKIATLNSTVILDESEDFRFAYLKGVYRRFGGNNQIAIANGYYKILTTRQVLSDSPQPHTVIALNGLTMRDSPSIDGDKLYTLPFGTIVTPTNNGGHAVDKIYGIAGLGIAITRPFSSAKAARAFTSSLKIAMFSILSIGGGRSGSLFHGLVLSGFIMLKCTLFLMLIRN